MPPTWRWASHWDTAWPVAPATSAGRSPALRSRSGWGLLSLHNDCRYKAFFQRLKSTSASYRIDGGAGGRPQPPAPWPRRGRAAITWPAYKLCEFHVALIGLTTLAVLAVVLPPLWLTLWRGGVILLGVLAPIMGIGRTARSISRNSVETEFARWFQPFETESTKSRSSS